MSIEIRITCTYDTACIMTKLLNKAEIVEIDGIQATVDIRLFDVDVQIARLVFKLITEVVKEFGE